MRTFDEGVRKRILAAIERIVNAEAEAPRPPEIIPLDRYLLNDKAASDRVVEALRAYFSADRVRHTGPAPASEDFGCFGTEWHAPSVFWFVGGTLLNLPVIITALGGGLVCFGLRVMAIRRGWRLPVAHENDD